MHVEVKVSESLQQQLVCVAEISQDFADVLSKSLCFVPYLMKTSQNRAGGGGEPRNFTIIAQNCSILPEIFNIP